ncbi:Uma2 family endonuclease [Nonomuraea terrae]|uniref:Uma2 family endonuclease n=1 Tax=Nonomuraea terrae TaxID=2530383 RepID=A0A4V2YHN1_9ACTN|nr:Uma2 family endonuclease [Nonomuraea terrae]TDD31377.1 Uma2 family endonuclease [Nonomuraea terrae]
MATIEPSTGRRFLPSAQAFTVDDLRELPDDGNRYELFNGSLLVSPSPTPLHQRIIYRLQRILDDAMPPGLEPLATVNVRVSDKDFYIPDLVVVREDDVKNVELMFAPGDILLAAEVVSPSTKMRDEMFKVEAYAKAGIPAYWRINPEEGPALYVHELKGKRYREPTVFKAGTAAGLATPFPISFDPANLVSDRR